MNQAQVSNSVAAPRAGYNSGQGCGFVVAVAGLGAALLVSLAYWLL